MDGVKIIAELLFAIVVSLPLSFIVSDHAIQPWLKSISVNVPLWVVTVAMFVIISITFLVREQLSVLSTLEKTHSRHHASTTHMGVHRGVRQLEGLM